MKKTNNILILVLITNLLHAQNPLVKQWDYRFGGTARDYMYCFQQTRDGGYILGGYSDSDISGDKTQASYGGWDYWVVKTDSLGNKEWDKDFGGTSGEALCSIHQTSDGGYILGGYSDSGIGGDKSQATRGGYDYWIIKTDSLGNKEWDKDFGGSGNDIFYSIQQTADGGYILGGYSSSGISGDKTQPGWGVADYWIVKTDALGNKQWDKDFGGTDNDVLFSLQQTADGGFILAGYSASGIGGDKTQASWGGADYWIVKTDSLGIKQWDRDFGGTYGDWAYSIQQTTDGGFILGGISPSPISGDKTQTCWGQNDYWIIKTDSLGFKQWDRVFGGTSGDELNKVSQTTDGGYLLSGFSSSPISGNKTESNLGLFQTWVVKTDSLGNKQWDKTLFTSRSSEISLAIQTDDGCYAIANTSTGGIGGYKTQANWDTSFSYDFWFIKFCETTCNITTPTITEINDTLFVSPQYVTYQWYYNSFAITGATAYSYVAGSSGNYFVLVTDSSGCSAGAEIRDVLARIEEEAGNEWHLIVFPNPATNEFVVYASPMTIKEIEIFNLLGEKVYSAILNEKQKTIKEKFPQGIYFVSVNNGERNVVKKLIIE